MARGGGSFPMDRDYSDEQYVTQMKDMRFISRTIAHLYTIASYYIGRAAFNYGSRNYKEGNKTRRIGLEYFNDLITVSKELPAMKEKGGDEIQKKILGGWDFLMPEEILEMFSRYSRLLTEAGLIQAYDMRDMALKNFRKY